MIQIHPPETGSDQFEPAVEILLATFNGERHLGAQLESIIRQTYPNWRLIARDDGSSDHTLAMLQEAGQEEPDRITLLQDSSGRLGAAKSFGHLMNATSAPYVMFCDQDDIWRPEKIRIMLEAIQGLELRFGAGMPLLVHSDLRVVTDDLIVLSDSFWRFQKLDPSRGSDYQKLLVQNVVTGSATMINRSLCLLAAPVPMDAAMHDWWLALTAAAFGKISILTEPLVDYRQHSENRIGAKEWGVSYVMRMAFSREGITERLAATQRQARAFHQRFDQQLDPHLREITAGYAELNRKSFINRRLFLLQHGITKNGFLRNLGLFAWC